MVQPKLWRITSPSLRTNSLVDTPTLAVCGAIGLPISAPTEFRVGNSINGKPSNCPTSAWNFPNMALVEVLLPDKATPMKPRIGATTMKYGPSAEKALASDPAMPEKLKTNARPKMKTPTRQAPHICDHVFLKISASCVALTLSSTATMIHDARIALPPTNGLKSNAAVIVAPAVIEDAAETARCSQLIAGTGDHGPVHSTTTTTSTMIGNQPWNTSPADSPWPSAAATCAAVTGTRP